MGVSGELTGYPRSAKGYALATCRPGHPVLRYPGCTKDIKPCGLSGFRPMEIQIYSGMTGWYRRPEIESIALVPGNG